MKTFAVWCTEYEDEGSDLFTRYTDKGAMRAYRKATGEVCSRDDLTPLSVAEMTPEMLAQRAAHGED
jgi:hypothetical protein